ncbi:hypothetical protein HPB47_012740 [Ixodes persulcatus]|uniref:Uncharacterized protein n=1 Tax=Ixodes persulcatus TaxID=34615 RepID=A0AC60NSS3_IXOPE|nr:hypothetical protein HPB47_012740 [Ixodes persulcatus]
MARRPPQANRQATAPPRRDPAMPQYPRRQEGQVQDVRRSKPRRGRPTCGERPTDARSATTAEKPTISTAAAPTVDLVYVVSPRTTHARGPEEAEEKVYDEDGFPSEIKTVEGRNTLLLCLVMLTYLLFVGACVVIVRHAYHGYDIEAKDLYTKRRPKPPTNDNLVARWRTLAAAPVDILERPSRRASAPEGLHVLRQSQTAGSSRTPPTLRRSPPVSCAVTVGTTGEFGKRGDRDGKRYS